MSGARQTEVAPSGQQEKVTDKVKRHATTSIGVEHFRSGTRGQHFLSTGYQPFRTA